MKKKEIIQSIAKLFDRMEDDQDESFSSLERNIAKILANEGYLVGQEDCEKRIVKYFISSPKKNKKEGSVNCPWCNGKKCVQCNHTGKVFIKSPERG